MSALPFWQLRWDAGNIGFHLKNVHKFLSANIHRLPQPSTSLPKPSVLVPLCGKSVDMLYLAQKGYRVVGVEFVEQACLAFFTETNLHHARSFTASGQGYYHTPDRSINLFDGDYFEFHLERGGSTGVEMEWMETGFDACYDRAALVAVEPELFEKYVSHTLSLLRPAAPILLLTTSYDQTLMTGPPYSLPPAAVRELFEPRGYEVKVVGEEEAKLGAQNVEGWSRAFAVGREVAEAGERKAGTTARL